MIFYNYKEEETNSNTKKIHKLLTNNEHIRVIELYNSIPDNKKTGEQTRCAVASLILEKRMEDARDLLDKWSFCKENDVQWNIQYGWTYYLVQNYKNAVTYFDKVEELDPRNTTMLGYLRECNEKIGNKEEVNRLKKRVYEIGTNIIEEKYTREKYYK